MSHNHNTVKSQDDLSTTNDGQRSSEVLLQAIEKCERLQKQLDVAIETLGLIDKRKCHMANCLQNCPLRKYYEKNKGCATCLNKACHTALQQIEDLNK